MSGSDGPEPTTAPSRDLAETRTAAAAVVPAGPVVELRPGSSVGRFLVLKQIGEGGMGSVWTAYDPDLDRKVALKLVRPDRSEGDDVRARMLREAQALARLSHPNVVTVHEVGVHDGNVVLAMEYVEGETLKAWLVRERPNGSPDRLARMLGIMRQAGQGLAAAHAAGMVHRDFKPANVIVGADHRVRVVDFGLARAREPPDPDSPKDDLVATFRSEQTRSNSGSRVELHESVTQTGAFIGTPRYMSPEQFEGGAVDPRSDIFSFATVLYEATYGESPWRSTTASGIYSEMLDGPPSPAEHPEVPAWLAKAVRRGLAPRASQRFASITEMLEALQDGSVARRRSFRNVAVLTALGVLAGAVPSLFLLNQSDPRFATCDDIASRGASMWNDDVAARVRSSFERTGVPYASAAFASIERVLSRYAAEWTETATSACVAVESAPQSAQAAERRAELACLRHAAAHYQDLMGLYASADANTVEHALDAISEMPAIKWCAAASTRGLGDDPLVAGIRSDLSRARNLGRLGKGQLARQVAEQVVEQAASDKLAPLRAEALFELGRLEPTSYASRELFDRAFWLAFGAGDDRLAARSAIAIVAGTSDPDTAAVWRRHALGVLARIDFDVELVATLQIALSSAAGHRGEYELACEYANTALRLLDTRSDPLDLGLSAALEELGVAYASAGQHERSNETLERALEVLDARLGRDHPRGARVRTFMATNLLILQDPASAERLSREAIASLEHTSVHAPRLLANARRILGETLASSGRRAEGIRLLESALETHGGAQTDLLTTDILRSLGTALLADGRPEESLRSLHRALEIDRNLRGTEHPHLAQILNAMTMSLAAKGDIEGAILATKHAADLRLRAGEHYDAAGDLANLGVLLFNQRRWSESITYCRRAVDLYDKFGRAADSHLSFPLRVLALSLLELERPREALAPLERALALHQTTPFDRIEIPKTKLALARALWDSRVDRVRARALALEAKTELAASKREGTVEYRETEDWLATH
jgi:eukaryotic-like serine/threonine-protein kinase